MAETIGFVSGILTLAQMIGGLGTLATKLRNLWGQIDQVPQRIQHLLTEVQIMGPVLSDVDNQLRNVPTDIWKAHYAICGAHYCQQALDTMSTLINDLDQEINSSTRYSKKAVAFKIVLKKHKVEALELRLIDSIHLLQMCLQCYTTALCRASYDKNSKILTLLEESRFFDSNKPVSKNFPADYALYESTESVRGLCRSGHKNISRFHKYFFNLAGFGKLSFNILLHGSFYSVDFHPSSWLAEIAYGFSLSWCLQQVNMRYYNIRSKKSDIFLRIANNDLPGMLRHFSDRTASPFDRDEDGLSLLHFAASTNCPEICQSLISLGLESCIDEWIEGHFTPRQLALLTSSWYKAGTTEDQINYMELFNSPSPESQPEDDLNFFLLGCSTGTSDLAFLSYFQRFAAPSLYDIPERERFEIARVYCCTGLSGDHPDTMVLRFLVKKDRTLCTLDIDQSTREGLSILHTIAIGFGRVCRMSQASTKRIRGKHLAQWCEELVTAVTLSKPDDLHSVENVSYEYFVYSDPLISQPEWIGSPLLSVLRSCCLDHFVEADIDPASVRELWRRVSSFTLIAWLEQLESANINLWQYGLKEKEIFCLQKRDAMAVSNFVLAMSNWSEERQEYTRQSYNVCLHDFEVSSRPDAWVLVWQFQLNDTAKSTDDWHDTNSCKAISMPGGWVD